MEFKTRVATIEDLQRLIEIEKNSTPTLIYIEDNAKFFFEETPGEIFVVDYGDGSLIGMGRYSTLPDGSGWLETLRVHKDYQGMGAGKLIYKDYLEYGKKQNAPAIRMYTERYNDTSKGLAELMHFSLAAELANFDIELKGDLLGEFKFQKVTSLDELDIPKIKSEWGKLISLNRTFYEVNEKNLQWFIDEGMVYKYGDNLLILGARMLKDRGLFIALALGDLEFIAKSAMIKANEMGTKKLTAIFPKENEEYKELLRNMNYNEIYNLLVMEYIL
ncbi:MAG: GNAT family N-acetyltransferase [Neofamilia sp.]